MYISILDQRKTPMIILISTAFSLISCFVINTKLYFTRIEKSHLLKKKNFEKDFHKFSKDLQLYITNPYQIQLLKF